MTAVNCKPKGICEQCDVSAFYRTMTAVYCWPNSGECRVGMVKGTQEDQRAVRDFRVG